MTHAIVDVGDVRPAGDPEALHLLHAHWSEQLALKEGCPAQARRLLAASLLAHPAQLREGKEAGTL